MHIIRASTGWISREFIKQSFVTDTLCGPAVFMEISRASARLMIGPKTAEVEEIEERRKSEDSENDAPLRIPGARKFLT